MPADMKATIAEAFLSLLQYKDVDKITVKVLVEACHISRQTFYYHFKDIVDVIEWCIRASAAQLLTNIYEADSPQNACRIIVESTIKDDSLIRKLMRSQKREEIETVLFPVMRQYMMAFARHARPDIDLSYSDLEALLDFCTFGMIGMIKMACLDGRTNVDLLSRQIYLILSGQMLSSR